MVKKEAKREFDSEVLILPAIKMVLMENDEQRRPNTKGSAKRNAGRPNQRTVLRIIEALNKPD
jgi:hypothetical protein